MAETARRTPAPSVRLFSDVPEADEAEQHRLVVDDSAAALERLRVPFEVDPADAFDQSRAVPLGEDDYR
jgi:hypothetical protein